MLKRVLFVVLALVGTSAYAQYYVPQQQQPQVYVAPVQQPCTNVGPTLPPAAMVQGRQPDVFHYHLHEQVSTPRCNTGYCQPQTACNQYPTYQYCQPTYQYYQQPVCQPTYQTYQPVYQQPLYYYYATPSCGVSAGLRFGW